WMHHAKDRCRTPSTSPRRFHPPKTSPKTCQNPNRLKKTSTPSRKSRLKRRTTSRQTPERKERPIVGRSSLHVPFNASVVRPSARSRRNRCPLPLSHVRTRCGCL